MVKTGDKSVKKGVKLVKKGIELIKKGNNGRKNLLQGERISEIEIFLPELFSGWLDRHDFMCQLLAYVSNWLTNQVWIDFRLKNTSLLLTYFGSQARAGTYHG